MVRKLSLAVAVALGVAPVGVTALGLGDIKLHSALNQTFNADIELLSVKQGEISDVQVELAPTNAFDQAGIERPFFLSNLRFKPEQTPDGKSVIRVSSREPIREPFLNFLIEVNWPKGSLVREYTVLLDPPVTMNRAPAPVMAPTSSAATRTAAPGFGAPSQPAASMAGIGEYGPTKRNDTLWNIAKAVRHSGVGMEQMVMSLFQANPEAFLNDNVNYLRVGKVLRVPSREEVLSAGSSSDARAAFRGQMDDWRAGRATAAAGQIAQPGSVPEPAPAPMATDQPEAGVPEAELRIASARPEGEGEAGIGEELDPATEVGRLRQDLATAEEARESALEEGQELQSRVSDLEAQLADLQRLLTLKNEQLARVQAAAAAAGMDLTEGEEAPGEQQMLEPTLEIAEAPVDSAGAAGEALPAETTEDMPAGEQTPGEGEILSEAPGLGEAEAIPGDEETVEEQAATTETGQPVADDATAADEVAGEAAAAEEAAQVTGESVADGGESGADEETLVIEQQEADTEQVAETAAGEGQASDETMVALLPDSADSAQPGTVPADAVSEQTVNPPATAAQPEPVAVAEVEAAPADETVKSDPISMAMAYAKKVANDPAMLGIAIAVVVVFLGLLWAVVSRRKTSEADFQESILVDTIEEDADKTQPLAEAVEPVSQTSEETSFLSDFSPSDIDALQDETGEVDPIAEADVYIAYGRYQQAEELIRQSMQREPQRLELKQKLFEILFATKDVVAFEALANEASADMQQKDPSAWERVVAMGHKLAPSVALFAAAASQTGAAAGESQPVQQPVADDTTLAGLDELDLDLTGLDDLDDTSASTRGEEDDGLDFDIDLKLDEALDADSGPDQAGLEAKDEDTLPDLQSADQQAGSDRDDMRLELPEDFLASGGASGLDLTGSGDSLEMDKLDLGDALEELKLPESGPEEIGQSLAEGLDDADDAGLQDEMLQELQRAAESDPGQQQGTVPDLPEAISLDELETQESAEGPGQLSDQADEVNTKLDLARAYVDMGDAEGARSLLEEVLTEGNNSQSGEAQRLLEELA